MRQKMSVVEVLFRCNCCQIDGWSRGNRISGNAVVRRIVVINLMTNKVVKNFIGPLVTWYSSDTAFNDGPVSFPDARCRVIHNSGL